MQKKPLCISKMMQHSFIMTSGHQILTISYLVPMSSILVLFHTRLYRKDAHNPQEVKKLVAFGLEKLVRFFLTIILHNVG